MIFPTLDFEPSSAKKSRGMGKKKNKISVVLVQGSIYRSYKNHFSNPSLEHFSQASTEVEQATSLTNVR
jgi:hypothetical protein